MLQVTTHNHTELVRLGSNQKPCVYILENGSQAYIGIAQDLNNKVRIHQRSGVLSAWRIFRVHEITGSEVTLSSIMYYEALLIRFMRTDSELALVNVNQPFDGPERPEDEPDFWILWTKLSVLGLVNLRGTRPDSRHNEVDPEAPQEDCCIAGASCGSVSEPNDTDYEKLDQILSAVNEMTSAVNKLVNKHGFARGLLAEFAAVDYFTCFGFSAAVADEELNQCKIDVIALKGDCRLLVQVKAGQASAKEIAALVRSVKNLYPSGTDSWRRTIEACVCAESFPANGELLRRGLEREFAVPLLLVHKYQILESCPKYKRVLG